MGKALTQIEAQQRIRENFAERVELISAYQNKRSNLILQCLDCGHTWETVASNVLYNRSNSIQHHCPNCGISRSIMVECAWCGRSIKRAPSDIATNKSGYFYCCKEHGNLHKNQLRLLSGEWDRSTNYRQKALSAYPHYCASCGWNEDERILEVHHIDKDHSNNRIENLILLCPLCHRKITLGYYDLDLTTHQLIQTP